MLLAAAVAVVHGTAVLLMLCGALLALRWRWLLAVHAPVALAILVVNLAGAPCPLTELELGLRADAGASAYTGGFLDHYVLAPLGLDVHGTVVQVGMYTVALGLNALGCGLLAARALRAHRSHLAGRAARPSPMPAGRAVPSGSQQ